MPQLGQLEPLRKLIAWCERRIFRFDFDVLNLGTGIAHLRLRDTIYETLPITYSARIGQHRCRLSQLEMNQRKRTLSGQKI